MTPALSAAVWGLTALAAGGLIARHLGRRGYRREDDEVRGAVGIPWWVGALAAVGGAVVGHVTAGLPLALAATMTIATVWMCGLSAIDLDVRRLPDAWTAGGLVGGLAMLGWCSLALSDGGRWVEAVGCAAVSGAVHLGLALVSPAGLGLGDVKLAVPLGALMGWFGWPLVVLGAVGAFVVGLLVGVLVAVRTGAGRRATFPFGPSMMASAWVVTLLACASLA